MDDFYADMHRGIERNRNAAELLKTAARYQHAVNQIAAERDEIQRDYDTLIGQNAGNLALRYAYASELAKFAPDHPLVRDAALRDRIVRHAKDTIQATNGDWNAVRELGATFTMPRRT
ncbi:hypothetical protein [Variovorax sp. RA8]|uniref:hypothetical protein n=1 Tax=Variovorax sp. (strain JCM 16519 / RA8) TaxID=662548 RepID=UPI001316826D|nr:hypothetical protein [Variovorax sp. RA8]VTU44946.1 hypothetical protein RA8P2_00382 [Variovorax sp. RA8]